jgi:hypothetical protein
MSDLNSTFIANHPQILLFCCPDDQEVRGRPTEEKMRQAALKVINSYGISSVKDRIAHNIYFLDKAPIPSSPTYGMDYIDGTNPDPRVLLLAIAIEKIRSSPLVERSVKDKLADRDMERFAKSDFNKTDSVVKNLGEGIRAASSPPLAATSTTPLLERSEEPRDVITGDCMTCCITFLQCLINLNVCELLACCCR